MHDVISVLIKGSGETWIKPRTPPRQSGMAWSSTRKDGDREWEVGESRCRRYRIGFGLCSAAGVMAQELSYCQCCRRRCDQSPMAAKAEARLMAGLKHCAGGQRTTDTQSPIRWMFGARSRQHRFI